MNIQNSPGYVAPVVTAPGRNAFDASKVRNSLANKIQMRRSNITTTGAVANAPGKSAASHMPSSITFTMTNGGGTTLTYVLGDPSGLVASAVGGTWTQPTASRGVSVAATQASFGTMPVAVKSINYQCLTTAQFANLFKYYEADVDGYSNGVPVNIDEFLRNNQYIATLQTIKFDSPYIMKTGTAFTLAVNAGETVTMTLILDAAAGR